MNEAEDERFGRLARLAASKGWQNEPTDFTPWLAQNLDLLGEELGLNLTLKQREYPVGRFYLDLLLEDADGRVVIVENQFGQTDHKHLGQLLTYSAVTQAKVVIWISERLNDEHIAALEWLNESTVADVGFYGVQLELFQIGSSPMAPHFRVMVKPNDWVKRVRPEPQAVEWSWATYETDLRTTPAKLEVAKAIFEQLSERLGSHGLDLQPTFRKGYVAFQRWGGYNVFIIDFANFRKIRFSIKLPSAPQALSLASPYPSLEERWIADWKEWGWLIGSVAEIPDLDDAVVIAVRHLPTGTPGVAAREPEMPA